MSGLDAPTTSEAKGNPVPVLLRVKTPAVLPNSVKANLKGCFVIADGKGNLATERAELLLVSLSCLDRKGQGPGGRFWAAHAKRARRARSGSLGG